MSGGVDSSVAAALLKKEGYDVTGVFMKNWSDETFLKDTTMCPWVTDQEDARKAAAIFDIPFYTFDFEKEYRAKVVEYMIQGYRNGVTPNPDIMCNREIKFGLFFERALSLGADYIATGHYARIRAQDRRYELLMGVDVSKDQSYFLYQLGQRELAKTLFPIGEYAKQQVRKMAREFDLPNAEKKDSQGICFIGDLDVHEFLKSVIPPQLGKILTFEGREVGEHEGVAYYTIGQRHGIGSPGGGTVYYVAAKDAEKNILYVAEGENDEHLYKKELTVVDSHWISGEAPVFPLHCMARIRYRQPLQECKVAAIDGGKLSVIFTNPQRAVTSGQSIVFYDSDTVLGGGVIAER